MKPSAKKEVSLRKQARAILNAEARAASYFAILATYHEISEIEDLSTRRQVLVEWRATMAECIQMLVDAAGLPCPQVWHAIGNVYNLGIMVRRDAKEAQKWFSRAAKAGYAKAMVSLALLISRPRTEKNSRAALKWLFKAAEMGNASSMGFIGSAYRDGQGVEVNPAEAAKWFMKAVAGGVHSYLVQAGRIYVRQLARYHDALDCFMKAANAGRCDIYLDLAELYDIPNTELSDPAKAVEWYQKVIASYPTNGPRAKVALAQHYHAGTGVVRDTQQAELLLEQVLLPERKRVSSDVIKRAEKLLREINKSKSR